jgi:hypothetical protein
LAHDFRKGQPVSWHWGGGSAHGTVEERFERRVQRTLKGTKVVRVGTKENPAYLIRQEDGDRVLKRGSELEPHG